MPDVDLVVHPHFLLDLAQVSLGLFALFLFEVKLQIVALLLGGGVVGEQEQVVQFLGWVEVHVVGLLAQVKRQCSLRSGQDVENVVDPDALRGLVSLLKVLVDHFSDQRGRLFFLHGERHQF